MVIMTGSVLPANPAPSEGDIEVPVSVRLRLEHACLELLAQRAGVRMLHVKGEAWHPVLAEGRSASSDADVLLAPRDVPAFERELRAAGWELITSFAHGSVFEHAATYYSPAWGTVDVHQRFPGIDRDPASAFEVLWDSRETITLGGREVAVPGLREQRLIMLIHAARDAMGRGPRDLEAAWGRADEHERAALDALADELGARVPLAYVTDRPERAAGQPEAHLWKALHENADATAVWRARLRDARGVREHLRILRAALRINPDHLALRMGHAPTAADRRREWVMRWVRGARNLLDRG